MAIDLKDRAGAAGRESTRMADSLAGGHQANPPVLRGFARASAMRRSLSAEVSFSPVYEALLSLFVFSRRRQRFVYDAGESWFEHARARLSAEVLEVIEQFPDGGWIWAYLLGAAVESRARSMAMFLQWLRAVSDRELVRTAAGFHQRRHSKALHTLIWRSINGDAAARQAAIRAIGGSGEECTATAFALDTSPAILRERLSRVVAGWPQEVYLPRNARVCDEFDEDVRAKQALMPTSADNLVHLITGIRYQPAARSQKLIFIPSMILSPSVLSVAHKELAVICYPLQLEKGAVAAVGRLVRAHRALGDSTRLRMLQILAAGSLSHEQLARRLVMPKDELAPQMELLRSAGLVDVRNVAGRISYSFRRRGIVETSSILHQYLDLRVWRGP